MENRRTGVKQRQGVTLLGVGTIKYFRNKNNKVYRHAFCTCRNIDLFNHSLAFLPLCFSLTLGRVCGNRGGGRWRRGSGGSGGGGGGSNEQDCMAY